MNKTIPDEQAKRKLWRDIIKEAKAVTAAGGGNVRILKEYTNHGTGTAENIDHIDNHNMVR